MPAKRQPTGLTPFCLHYGKVAAARKSSLSRNQLPQDDTERIDITLTPQLESSTLLRSHVSRSPTGSACGRLPTVSVKLIYDSKAEIDDLGSGAAGGLGD